MNDRELLYVKTIAEERSISKAAARLYLSQPSLSQSVQRIERELGTKLFIRTASGLTLTYAGEKYYQLAARVLRMYGDFQQEVSDINHLRTGRVTFGITAYLATFVLPATLPAFREKCPNIEVIVVEKSSAELDRILANGGLDFALMHTPPQADVTQSAMSYTPLYQEPFILASQPERIPRSAITTVPGLAYPMVDLRALGNESYIQVERGRRIRQVSDQILRKAGISPPVVLTTTSFETARRLAASGFGFTFISQRYSEIFSTTPQPAYYSLNPALDAYWTLHVVMQKNAYLSVAAKMFVHLLQECLGGSPLPEMFQ